MWKLFQKEALGILRDTSRIDSFKIPDHVVPSEFSEMKVTLEMNSAKSVDGDQAFESLAPGPVKVLSFVYLIYVPVLNYTVEDERMRQLTSR